ncbi:MFS transporter [Candidatus Acetothermia bacterium]|jgi:GPH family glycoside/pentoside/hexuronide:cation symporter|nr:MFS transporter [Candidatus Acetothermia bacterium]MCI2432667.1 MFS transporter [Candidatus Acetothermia bacterium]MCI2437461.1 MFS transporter [Candidatus Acetothermia bacterium]
MRRWQKIAYSTGSLGIDLANQTFTAYILFFYLDTLKLDPALVGLGWGMLYALWNAINDPLVGYLSDRTRTRWGRRIPYILFGTPLFVLSFILLWMPPTAIRADSHLLFLYFLGILLLFDLFYTLVTLNRDALFPEMFSDPGERARVSALRVVFSQTGVFIALVIAPLIFDTHGWDAMALVFGAIIGATLLLSLLGSREEERFRRAPPLDLKAAFVATFRNRAFLTYTIYHIFNQTAFIMLPAMIPFYVKYVLGVPPRESSVLLGIALLVTISTLYFWSRAAARWGTRTTMMAASMLFALALTPFLWVESFWATAIVSALLGISFGGLFLLPTVFIAEITDEDELVTGVRREGMYFGMSALLVRLAFMLQGLTMATILNLTGYEGGLATQPDQVIWGIRVLIALVPILAIGLGLLALRLYPLHGERLAHLRAQLTKLHAQRL